MRLTEIPTKNHKKMEYLPYLIPVALVAFVVYGIVYFVRKPKKKASGGGSGGGGYTPVGPKPGPTPPPDEVLESKD